MSYTDDDYTEGDRWDWDQSDDSQYCKHGTFIGSSWGPDLLCGYCEDGTTLEEFAEIQAYHERDSVVRLAQAQAYDDVSLAIRCFRDKTRRDPHAMGEWITATLDEIKQTSTDELREYVR